MCSQINSHRQRLRDHSALLVRRAVLRDDWIADAIFDLASNGQRMWTPAEWFDLLTELESSDMTIGEFLDFYG